MSADSANDDWWNTMRSTIQAEVKAQSHAPCISTDDSDYIYRLNNSYTISNEISNVDFVSPYPMCIRVPSNTENTPVTLDRCDNAIQIFPKVNSGVYNGPAGKTVFRDNLMYLGKNDVLYNARDRNGCLEVKNGKVVFTTNGCDGKMDEQRFLLRNHSLINVATGKCLTATGFTNDSIAAMNSGKNVPISKDVVVGDCPTPLHNTITAYDPQNDALFQFGTSNGMNGATKYKELADMYSALKSADKAELQHQLEEKNKKIQLLNNELDDEINLYNDELQINNALLKTISGNQYKYYTLIENQTDTIQQNIQKMKQQKMNESTLNKYQMEQNQQIQNIHKGFFLSYFVVAFLFLIVFFMNNLGSYDYWSLFILLMMSVVVIIYHFVILFIEYGFVFSFYFVIALILGKPFVMNKLPPTNPVFFTP